MKLLTVNEAAFSLMQAQRDWFNNLFSANQFPAGSTTLCTLSPGISGPEAGELPAPSNHNTGRVTPHCSGDSCNAN
jgi:hypothetical protein